MDAILHLDTQHHVGPIDRRIFSGFLEHLGRAVYEGVYDPGNPLSDARGFRRDVLDALRPLAMPLIRYPGGNFVSCYDWRDGIGPCANRPTRPDFAWKSVETNQFGTDEFLAWCQDLGTAPMMAVNLGTGSTENAGHLLEYCNLDIGTYWGDQRRRHGHAEPYGVKVWCLGNEMDGPWQAGHVPAEVYAQRARQAAALMKGLDPSIETVLCGSSGRGMPTYLEYDRVGLEFCWNYVDYVSAHRYSNNSRQDSAWFLAEGTEIDRVLADYAGLLAYVRGRLRSPKQVHLSFDEWNVWYRQRGEDGNWAKAPHLLEEVYNLEDALVCAQYLNAFIRRADLVKIACIAQVVNVIAPVLTRPEGILRQTIYYPLAMFSQHAAGLSLHPVVVAPECPAGERGQVPVLDASASYDPATGTAAVFLVNRGLQTPLSVDIRFADATVASVLDLQVLTGAPKAANSWEQPDQVQPVAATSQALPDGALRVTVPAPGFAVAKLRLAKR